MQLLRPLTLPNLTCCILPLILQGHGRRQRLWTNEIVVENISHDCVQIYLFLGIYINRQLVFSLRKRIILSFLLDLLCLGLSLPPLLQRAGQDA